MTDILAQWWQCLIMHNCLESSAAPNKGLISTFNTEETGEKWDRVELGHLLNLPKFTTQGVQ